MFVALLIKIYNTDHTDHVADESWPVLIAGNLEENLISGAWSDFLKFMLIVLIFGGLTPICRFWRLREIQA